MNVKYQLKIERIKEKHSKKTRHFIKRNNGTTQEHMLNMSFNQQEQTVGKNFALK